MRCEVMPCVRRHKFEAILSEVPRFGRTRMRDLRATILPVSSTLRSIERRAIG